jgi:hypothetical protein
MGMIDMAMAAGLAQRQEQVDPKARDQALLIAGLANTPMGIILATTLLSKAKDSIDSAPIAKPKPDDPKTTAEKPPEANIAKANAVTRAAAVAAQNAADKTADVVNELSKRLDTLAAGLENLNNQFAKLIANPPKSSS